MTATRIPALPTAARGWNQGEFSGRLSNGTRCAGHWTARNAFGVGEAEFTCPGKTKGRAIFFYQDSKTGTAMGRGATNDGLTLRFWTGANVLEFLSGTYGKPQLPCGARPVPIS